MSNKLLFVDYYGVISHRKIWTYFLDNGKEEVFQKIEQFLFKENYELFKDWMRGTYNSEEICKIISNGINENYNDILEALIVDCKYVDLSNDIRTLLLGLKSDYRIILLTDNMDCFDRWTLDQNSQYFSVFDRIDNSYNIGYLKFEDNNYFQNIFNLYNSNYKNSVFVDDDIINCQKFTNLGGISHAFIANEKLLDFFEGV